MQTIEGVDLCRTTTRESTTHAHPRRVGLLDGIHHTGGILSVDTYLAFEESQRGHRRSKWMKCLEGVQMPNPRCMDCTSASITSRHVTTCHGHVMVARHTSRPRGGVKTTYSGINCPTH